MQQQFQFQTATETVVTKLSKLMGSESGIMPLYSLCGITLQ